MTSIGKRAGALALAISMVLVTMAASVGAHEGEGGGPGIPGDTPELEVVGTYDVPVVELTTDVWAYGNYAYIGSFDSPICSLDWTGVRVIDISDPSDPSLAAFIPAKPGTRNNDVKVTHIETPSFTGEILTVTNESCGGVFQPRAQSKGVGGNSGQGGVSIWDVTDPTNPKPLKQNFLKFQTHNTFVWQQDDNAYMMVVDDENVQDVHIVDVTKPQAPRAIAQTGQLDWPDDIADEFEGSGSAFLHDIWVQDDVAYLAYWDAGLVMLDVSDPANPVFLGDSEYANPDPLSGQPPAGTGHVAVPNADGTRVLFGDEDFAAETVAFTFEGVEYPAAAAGFGPSAETLAGEVVWTGGEGCTDADVPDATGPGQIALIQRGTCFFQDKAEAAFASGYAGYIVANDAARGDGLVAMAPRDGGPYPPIPGLFVGNSTGEIMKAGGNAAVITTFDGYGYLRLMDVTDPANIVELDQFATEGVFMDPPLPGDRTMHNVVVDSGTTAYISWYAEGMRVVSFEGDELTELYHYVDEVNGSNFWGVYLHTLPSGEQLILGSDRDKGLVIFADPIATP